MRTPFVQGACGTGDVLQASTRADTPSAATAAAGCRSEEHGDEPNLPAVERLESQPPGRRARAPKSRGDRPGAVAAVATRSSRWGLCSRAPACWRRSAG